MTFRPNEEDPYALKQLSDAVIVHSHSQPLHSIEACCSNDRDPTKSTAIENANKTASNPPLLINHNTCASYQHAFDLDLFRTALLATSKIEGF